MSYVDLATIHDPVTGTVAPAAWGDQIRENQEFLIDPPACSVSHSVFTNISTATETTLPANTEAFDNDSMHSTVTNTSRVTIQTAGRYLMTANAEFGSNTTGIRQLWFQVNGTDAFGVDRRQATSSLAGISQSAASRVLAAGDYVEARAFQNSGGTITVRLVEFTVLYLTR